MGLSASQARFLQLTARRSDIEYEAQQINFQRLQLSEQLSRASQKYQDATSNRKMMFSFNSGSGVQSVDISYTNYKNYINQQLEGLSSAHERFFLVSSSGNKFVVANEEEQNAIIQQYTKKYPVSQILDAKEKVANATEENPVKDSFILTLAKYDLTSYESQILEDDNGNKVEYLVDRKFSEKDFLIAEDLDDVSNFQNAIQEGIYYFATMETNEETGEKYFNTQGWDTLGGGAISEVYDKSDDAEAEAEFETLQSKIQTIDKKLELR